jgi:O-antigen ligase
MTTTMLEDLKAIRIAAIWRFLKSQPLSFWFVCIYLMVEYVRPQLVYPAIDVIPWGQTVLILAAVTAILEQGTLRLPTVASPLILLFTAIVLASSATAYDPNLAFSNLEPFLVWVLVFLLITNVVTTEGRFLVFLLLFLLVSFKMSQHGARSWAAIGFGFRDWGVTGSPGWFHNSGEFGIQMCVFIPLSVAFVWAVRNRLSIWKLGFFLLMPITAIMSIIATSSRGAIVGAGALLVWWLAVSRRFRTMIVSVAVIGVAYLVTPDQQLARLNTMGEDHTSETRIARWQEGIRMMNEHPLLGVGYSNWSQYRVSRDDYGGPGFSHNIFVDAGAELGYTGLTAFLLLILATVRVNHQTRRLLADRVQGRDRFLYTMAYGIDGALVGFLTSGFFVSVLFYPYFWINLAMAVSLNVAARQKVQALRTTRLVVGKRGGRGIAVRGQEDRALVPPAVPARHAR